MFHRFFKPGKGREKEGEKLKSSLAAGGTGRMFTSQTRLKRRERPVGGFP